MGTTPTYALPYPELDDPDNVPADVQELAEAVEAALGAALGTGAIPGEVKLWPGAALPNMVDYGRYAWCDGVAYNVADYPKAAANISPAWKTAFGLPDPGAGKFRVPDLRGVAPFGLDAMPGGARANRIARAVADDLAGSSGEEYHSLTQAELAAHAHGVNDGGHAHGVNDPGHGHGVWYFYDGGSGQGRNNLSTDGGANGGPVDIPARATGVTLQTGWTGVSLQSAGGGGAHENLPPAVFVPYIVKLDDPEA
jgi:microcystin-dependent protein